MTPVWEGVILGITLAFFFSFGPALFAIIQTSIHRGLWSGFQLAFGIFLSDVAFVALCFLGAINIINSQESLFGIGSGIILVVFGFVTFTRKAHMETDKDENNSSAPGPLTFILKGFFLNIANPFVWFFWMGVVVTVTANYKGDTQSLLLFFAGTLLTVLVTDLLKCFGSFQIKKYLTPKFIQWINKIAGIGLVLFGIYLIIRTIIEF